MSPSDPGDLPAGPDTLPSPPPFMLDPENTGEFDGFAIPLDELDYDDEETPHETGS